MSSLSTTLLAPVRIVGLGAVTPVGRDLDEITARLLETADDSAPKRTSDAHLGDPAIARHMRRADRYARLAATAAMDAWNASAATREGVPLERIGMIVTSGFGPHGRGFRFLDGILDNGDSAASPTDFSHSVHGAASAYISGLLGIQGPSLNITDFEIGFEEAIRLAQCWLSEGACDRVLVGAVEELGQVMLHCVAQMTAGAAVPIVPGEGSVFMMLAPQEVAGLARIRMIDEAPGADVLMLEDPAAPSAERRMPPVSQRAATITDHLGLSASGAAFGALAAVLSLRAGRPLGRAMTATTTGALDSAATFRSSSTGDVALVIDDA
jgi:hypothetical protein